EDVEREVVLLEQPGPVADLGDEGLADAAPADRDLEPILGAAGARRRDGQRQHSRRDPCPPPHVALPTVPLSTRPNNGSASGATRKRAAGRLNDRLRFVIVRRGRCRSWRNGCSKAASPSSPARRAAWAGGWRARSRVRARGLPRATSLPPGSTASAARRESA